MKKREADFGVLFRHWIKANPWNMTAHFELKQTQTDSIPFACLEDNQIVFGEAIRDSNKGVLIRNIGSNGEPDYTYTYRDPVFIAIKFPGEFHILSLAAFTEETRISKRKSLTRERARKIATISVTL